MQGNAGFQGSRRLPFLRNLFLAQSVREVVNTADIIFRNPPQLKGGSHRFVVCQFRHALCNRVGRVLVLVGDKRLLIVAEIGAVRQRIGRSFLVYLHSSSKVADKVDLLVVRRGKRGLLHNVLARISVFVVTG